MSHETLRDTVNISSMTAGRYKARKRFTVQIMKAAGKKTKGILCYAVGLQSWLS